MATAQQDSRSPDLTVVTVLYGGQEVAERCVSGWIRSFDTDRVAFVVVDNSPTAIMSNLPAAHPHARIEYVHDPSNPGFGASANRGISISRSRLALLLNADVVVTPAEADQILHYLAHAESVTCLSLVTDGLATAGVEFTWFGMFRDRPVESRRAAVGPSGGAALLDTQVFSDLGGFDPDVFAWGEDAGLAMRMFSSETPVEVLDLRLFHIGGHSVDSKRGAQFKARLLARNRVIVAKREFSVCARILIGPLHWAALLANGLVKVRAGIAPAYFYGLYEGVRAARTRPSLSFADGTVTFRRFLNYQLSAKVARGSK